MLLRRLSKMGELCGVMVVRHCITQHYCLEIPTLLLRDSRVDPAYAAATNGHVDTLHLLLQDERVDVEVVIQTAARTCVPLLLIENKTCGRSDNREKFVH